MFIIKIYLNNNLINSNLKVMNIKKGISILLSSTLSLMLLLSAGSFFTASATDMFGESDLTAIGTTTGLGTTSVQGITGNIIKSIIGLFGIVATAFIVYGGILWMTSGGEEEKVKKAKKLMISGIIGMIIIVSAYAITSYLLSNLLGAAVA
ncbi:hypothetical protein EOM09_00020 [bacterium]|nr:hypothetical protein [bacterium]